MTATLEHRDGCAVDPRYVHAGNDVYGRRNIHCRKCGAITWHDQQPTIVPVTSRYRCREHPDQPVTWKGTGCPDCQPRRPGPDF